MDQQIHSQHVHSEKRRVQPCRRSQSMKVLPANRELKGKPTTECGAPTGNFTKSLRQQRFRHSSAHRSASFSTSRLENTDVAIQERQKQQQRFSEALLVQREMSQLEREHEELEDVASVVEQALREAEGTAQEARFKRSWLRLVNEKSELVKKITELGLRLKELQLEHKEYEVDKELNELSTIPDGQQTEHQKERFEELLQQKLSLVEERDRLVLQVEEEMRTKREQEETLMTDQGLGRLRP